jgi:hypothetical protein
MKKVTFLLTICLMVGFTSCSKDGGDSSDSIVGHWQSVLSSDVSTNLNTGEVYTSEGYSDTSLSIRLYEDGTCQYGSYSGTYKHQGNELNIYYSYEYDALQRDGETYVKKHVDKTYNYTIKELSPKRMVLQNTFYGTNSEGDWKIDKTTTMEKVN